MMNDDALQDRLRAAEQNLYYHWGEMASKWGINRTMAQIHALLFITGEPMTMDDIIERLTISRGNASMNLRELIDWGVVRREHHPGDRKEFYVAEQDVWAMFFRVLAERKRRELDPTVVALRNCLKIAADEEAEKFALYRKRVNDLLEVFTLFDIAFRSVDESNLRETARALAPQLFTSA